MSEYLSDTELFYAPASGFSGESLLVSGEEAKHLSRVMRKKEGDKLMITDGEGKLYTTEIASVSDKQVLTLVKKTRHFVPQFPGVIVCLPVLKSEDRMEFALEKCIELGFTKFQVAVFEHCVKKNVRLDRLKKIALAAMKQSLRTILPDISMVSSKELLSSPGIINLVAEQHAELQLISFRPEKDKIYRLITGPEGGLSGREVDMLSGVKVNFGNSRLRSETATITGSVLISQISGFSS